MADVNNNAKLRDVMGVPFYPMVVDSDGVDIKITLNNLKSLINGLQTSITNINTDIDNVEGDLNSLLDVLNAYIDNVNKRIELLEGFEDLDTTGLMRIYKGPDNLYVNHHYSGSDSDGSIDKPFSSYAQLNEFLKFTKIINKPLNIYVTTSSKYNEQLIISDFTGSSGRLKYYFNASGEFVVPESANVECGIKVTNVKVPLILEGYRVHYTAHGILCYNCSNVEVSETIINTTSGYGVLYDNTCGKITHVDFCNSYCAMCASGTYSNMYAITTAGNGRGEAFRALHGGTIHYGTTASQTISSQEIPKGTIVEDSGTVFRSGNVTPTNSWHFPPTETTPTQPETSDYTASFNATGLGTYQYQWSNWSGVRECKSGVYGSYGDKAGHIFFDLTAVRKFLNSGTVIDGATITLTRANSGGISAATDIWVGGSSCSSASGTPAYGNKAKVGALSWGESKTFKLTKAIVDGIKNGSYNSITTHGSGYSNIVACKIILKINK